VAAGDFNEDGVLDVVTAVSNQLSVSIGIGDGSFNAGVQYSPSNLARQVRIADLNGDGHLDLVNSVWGATSSVVASFGNGDGTFKAGISYSTTAQTHDLRLADFNNDGIIDVAVSTESSQAVNVLLGNSDGSFRAGNVIDVGSNAGHLEVGDFNDDGVLDIISSGDGGVVSMLLGHGDGSFQTPVAYQGSSSQDTDELKVGDFNNDGALDLVVTNVSNASLTVLIGNGDGTLKAFTEISAPGEAPVHVEVADFDGNGALDILSAGANNPVINFGNGDGSFQASVSIAIAGGGALGVGGLFVADFNGDGALDFVNSDFNGNSISILLANTQQTSFIAKFDLKTRAGALEAMDEIDEALVRVNVELGGIGATQSRLTTAVSNLQVARENFMTATSQIADVDVASETANLVRNQILQQAGAAILAQANQAPALALALLE
jgi:flagellin-like hook-associated protein FlgL